MEGNLNFLPLVISGSGKVEPDRVGDIAIFKEDSIFKVLVYLKEVTIEKIGNFINNSKVT